MSKQDLIDNLGTIASSGSKKFIEQVKNDSRASGELAENIIGQFGVGFYSCFIVGESVEVLSRKQGEKGYIWTSDGSGTYDIQELSEEQLETHQVVRGTKIVIHLRTSMMQFCN